MTASDPSPAPTPSSPPPDADAIPTRLSLDWPGQSPPPAVAAEPDPPAGAAMPVVVTAPDVVVAADPLPGARAWPLWQRIVFRYVLCHVLLYTLPSPLIDWFRVLASGLDFVAWKANVPELKQGVFAYPKQISEGIGGILDFDRNEPGAVDLGWQEVTTWTTKNVWAPFGDVIHQGTGSGDTAHDWTRVVVIVALSLLLAAIWSALDRRPVGYPRLGRWLHLYARWYLAIAMLSYGFAKLYGGQFGEFGPLRLTTEVGELRPMTMVGTFMQASRPYELLGGFGEVLGGMLLFHRRTALFGAVVTIVVMANVVALNWMHGVPVKLYSTHLLLIACGLLAPYVQSLWAVFVANRPTQPVHMAVVQRPWLVWLVALFGWSWAGAHIVDAHFRSQRQEAEIAKRSGPKPALFGAWRVEAMSLDGVVVPATDASRWRLFGWDRRSVFAREASGRTHWFRGTEHLAENRIDLVPAAGGDALTWTVEQGRKTVKEATLAARTRADFSKAVDVERRTLVLTGPWNGKQLVLKLVERGFPLQRPFQWVQELPEGW
jgi:hypothetical protein